MGIDNIECVFVPTPRLRRNPPTQVDMHPLQYTCCGASLTHSWHVGARLFTTDARVTSWGGDRWVKIHTVSVAGSEEIGDGLVMGMAKA
jgi:hypothetical protein